MLLRVSHVLWSNGKKVLVKTAHSMRCWLAARSSNYDAGPVDLTSSWRWLCKAKLERPCQALPKDQDRSPHILVHGIPACFLFGDARQSRVAGNEVQE